MENVFALKIFTHWCFIWILQEGMAYDLVIGTTKIVTGNTLAETYMDKLG
uniref:Vacuolar protein sorting-associated protein 33-like protein n=1 Tax=Rhizophora mucronata TaxID=61149 RepID=A0A2P2LXM4_RHIMU